MSPARTPRTAVRSAELCSRFKPQVPIIAISRCAQTARQLHLYRAVFPLYYNQERKPEWPADVDARINYGIQVGQARGFVHKGDPIMVVTGWREGSGFTNTVRLQFAP